MNAYIAGVARAAAETLDFPEPILEMGSYRVAGQEEIANLRPFFPGKRYIGVDARHGPGVDSVENIEDLGRDDASVGSVLALNVFEHVQRFWQGFAEVHRVLRPDGVLLVSCPFYFHIHAHPNDYWRLTPEALRFLIEQLPEKIIGFQGTRTRPLSVWALAVGPAHAEITNAQHQKFRGLIRQYARRELSWDRSLRYRLGSLLCGRRPFEPFLASDNFETQLIRGK